MITQDNLFTFYAVAADAELDLITRKLFLDPGTRPDFRHHEFCNGAMEAMILTQLKSALKSTDQAKRVWAGQNLHNCEILDRKLWSVWS